MITSVIEMLKTPKFGHITTFTIIIKIVTIIIKGAGATGVKIATEMKKGSIMEKVFNFNVL